LLVEKPSTHEKKHNQSIFANPSSMNNDVSDMLFLKERKKEVFFCQGMSANAMPTRTFPYLFTQAPIMTYGGT
jgi:hypothetical protein